MVMDTIQIRISNGLVRLVDGLVKKGIYANRSDVIRDAVRHFVWRKEVGTISDENNSVEQVRKVRKELSKGIKAEDLKSINNL
jgi:Arc/MetJ-type ribon-helix-helix transcriptional regulator